jgi:hypothetical protein
MVEPLPWNGWSLWAGISGVFGQNTQATQATVLNEYQQAVKADQFNPLAGDSTVLAHEFESSKSRAEVLSAIKSVDLTEGDAS